MWRKHKNRRIKALAYFHRYGFIFLILLSCVLVDGDKYCFILGGGLIVLAIWTFVGYLLKWEHIYCSCQNANHQKMTPGSVNWDKITKDDVIGLPIALFVFGIAAIAVAYFS